jgi:hypothetical protein
LAFGFLFAVTACSLMKGGYEVPISADSIADSVGVNKLLNYDNMVYASR